MSAERKKLLWIALSVSIFVLVLAATGFFLFAPKKTGGGLSAPASVGNAAVPQAPNPQDFLMTPPPTPPSDQSSAGGNVIVVYGNNPANLGGAAAGNPAGGAAGGQTTSPEASLAAAQGSLGGQSQAAAGQPGTAATAAQSVAAPAASAAPPVAKPAAPAASIQRSSRRESHNVAEYRRTVSRRPEAKESKAVSYRERAKAVPVRVTEYWIQAASFTSRDRADNLRRALAEKGIASLITVKNLAGANWYRVRVGPYSIKAEAANWLSKIQTIPNCGQADIWTDVVLRNE